MALYGIRKGEGERSEKGEERTCEERRGRGEQAPDIGFVRGDRGNIGDRRRRRKKTALALEIFSHANTTVLYNTDVPFLCERGRHLLLYISFCVYSI